jgi:multidrug efflux system membrane fusion protein
VGTDQDRKFVMVLGADSTVQYRGVTLGPLAEGLRVVRTGLRPGERIVVNGLQRVRPGAKVQAQPARMDAPPGEAGAGGPVAAAGGEGGGGS